MKNFMKQLPFLAPIVLRLGLAGVFIWFGLSQIFDPNAWTSYIPDIAIHATGISAFTLVIGNGILEVSMAILLVFGIWVRPVAGLLFLHMCGIVASVGLDSIGMRDIAIAAGLLSVTLYGNDLLSWHYKPLQPITNLLQN
jgi:uncharacterized membrane protein YphA (DoxX/SURF4 family)